MTSATPRVIALDDLAAHAGERLGVSRWETVTQEQISVFADATGDHQWIHVDPERAASGPWGTTIAHGYLILSLVPQLLWEVLQVTGASKIINYGAEKVRFPAPVPAGSRVRVAIDLYEVKEVIGGIHVTMNCTFEVEGGKKPVCVAEILFRYYT
jgi:acyl dehydratase